MSVMDDVCTIGLMYRYMYLKPYGTVHRRPKSCWYDTCTVPARRHVKYVPILFFSFFYGTVRGVGENLADGGSDESSEASSYGDDM